MDRNKIYAFVWICIAFLAVNTAKADINGRRSAVAGIDICAAVDVLEEMEIKEQKEKEDSEIDLLAHLIYAENGDDSYTEYMKAMEYTGSVVLNRVKSEKYPDTLEGVIYQRGQYACTWDGGMDKEPSDDAYEVASKLIRSGSKLPENVLYAAEFKQGTVFEKVAGTYYCY